MASASHLDTYLSKYIPDYESKGISSESLAFAAALDTIAKVDPEISRSIVQELADQRTNLKLIASENYASPATLLAMGNWLSDKYAEGVSGHRFYAACDNIDAVETKAVELAKEIFGADHAYVQPHSGIDANLVAFWTILTKRVEAPALEKLGAKTLGDLSPEDWETLRQELGNQKMMGMALDAGGHLTHGFRPNVSGKLFRYCAYTVDPETCILDYDTVRKRAQEEKPLLIIAGYSSYPRKINFRIFREIADEVGATLMVDMAHFAGLVAGKVFTGDFDPVAHAHVVTTTTHKTLRGPRGGLVLCDKDFADTLDRGCPLVLGGPLGHIIAAKAIALTEAKRPEFKIYSQQIVDNCAALADALLSEGAKLVTGGTDNHLILMDVGAYGLTGRQAESAIGDAGITLNRNVIPNDPNGAWYTSGVRLGTPALTTLGMGPDEMKEIAAILHRVLSATEAGTIKKGPSAGKPSKAKFVLDDKVRDTAAGQAADLLTKFPLYPQIEL